MSEPSPRSDTPDLEAILASIRTRVLEPGRDVEPAPPPAAPAAAAAAAPAAPVPLADVMMTGAGGGMTLDDLMRSMLAPQIQAWLDANMPEIVERLAREEIRRLTARL
ncbi:MAG: DUF2497 domain-containing protein [Sphingomonadales bacterium]|jgi:cell pole-organizing protein PopZ